MLPARASLLVLIGAALFVSTAGAQVRDPSAPQPPPEAAPNPIAALETTIAAAEGALRDRELQIGESHYRSALLQGWMLLGALSFADGRLDDARTAFREASAATFDARLALQSLAVAEMQLGETREAVRILTRLAGAHPADMQIRTLLAQALVASGQPQDAVQELEEAHAAAPDDPEVMFNLASGYLRLKKLEAAERLFARVARERPVPQTDVLIGRIYRDFGEYDRARAALRDALRKDPRTRRAHYYLGTIAIMADGMAGLDEAIAGFREELKLSPSDPLANLRLGMALVEARQHEAALPRLERAAGTGTASAAAFYFLGRCQLALDRAPEAVASLRKALELLTGEGVDPSHRSAVHYQLALALRRTGADEAAAHFAEAERTLAREVDQTRESLARYLADAPETPPAALLAAPIDSAVLAGIPPAQRQQLEGHIRTSLARAYLNLGIMQVQAQRFGRAAEFIGRAADVDPDLPQVHFSLGVALFNAKEYDKAIAPLERVTASDPANADARRMLALSWLNLDAFGKAAALLADDPQRARDPSLQYAYGVALVHSDRAAEAEQIFSRLVADHGDTAELNVVLGQAHAQQGDFEAAIASLRRALELNPKAPDANAALGIIYLKQGKLAEAAAALRAELDTRPDDVRSRYHLATVLELEGEAEEAIGTVRAALKLKPQFSDARYLLGKMLIARGDAAEAVQHLEVAARLAPEDAHVHYQLGQGYQKLGRTDLAEQAFERYRELKDKRRGGTP